MSNQVVSTSQSEARLLLERMLECPKTAAEKVVVKAKLARVSLAVEVARYATFVPTDWDDNQKALYGLLVPAPQQEGLLRVTSVDLHPTQVSGEVNGKPFYFRARNRKATIKVVEPGSCPVSPAEGEILLKKERVFAEDVGGMTIGDAVAFIRKAVAFLV